MERGRTVEPQGSYRLALLLRRNPLDPPSALPGAISSGPRQLFRGASCLPSPLPLLAIPLPTPRILLSLAASARANASSRVASVTSTTMRPTASRPSRLRRGWPGPGGGGPAEDHEVDRGHVEPLLGRRWRSARRAILTMACPIGHSVRRNIQSGRRTHPPLLSDLSFVTMMAVSAPIAFLYASKVATSLPRTEPLYLHSTGIGPSRVSSTKSTSEPLCTGPVNSLAQCLRANLLRWMATACSAMHPMTLSSSSDLESLCMMVFCKPVSAR